MAGVAAARTNSQRGVMTAVPNAVSLGFTRWIFNRSLNFIESNAFVQAPRTSQDRAGNGQSGVVNDSGFSVTSFARSGIVVRSAAYGAPDREASTCTHHFRLRATYVGVSFYCFFMPPRGSLLGGTMSFNRI